MDETLMIKPAVNKPFKEIKGIEFPYSEIYENDNKEKVGMIVQERQDTLIVFLKYLTENIDTEKIVNEIKKRFFLHDKFKDLMWFIEPSKDIYKGLKFTLTEKDEILDIIQIDVDKKQIGV